MELPNIKPRERWNNKIIIGYIGRLIKWKNVESFIRAVYQLDAKILQKCHFVIVGDGPEKEYLESLDRERIFEFTGNKSFQEAIRIQASFDIHIHCSPQ